MKGKNCPNCGAVFTLDDIKCPYCGTLYLDMGCLDLSENTPVFIRYRVPYSKEMNAMTYMGKDYAYITQMAIPRLGSMEVSIDTSDCVGRDGRTISRIYNRTNCTMNLSFEAIPFGKDKSLYKIDIEE